MPKIAISYRRADSAAISGRIFDRLTQHYGAGRVFMDIDEIPFGIDFRRHVADVLSSCDAVVVVIGQHWAGLDGPVRRIDQPADPVRVEVQTALERDILVVPVLVDGAGMPEASELPGVLEALAFRNACEVATGRDFHAHVDRLIRSMDRMLPGAGRPQDGTGFAASHLEAATPPAAIGRPVADGGDAAPPVAASAPSRATPEPWTPLRLVFLAAFLALPQLVQFTARTPLFVVALFVSVVGTAIVIDREDGSVAARTMMVATILVVATVLQSALAVLRTSFLEW